MCIRDRTRTTSAKLAVNAAAAVTLGRNHHETTLGVDAFAQLNVGAPTGHVGRHGYGARLASAGDNLSLLLVELGVED